jgi:hypothetical protein
MERLGGDVWLLNRSEGGANQTLTKSGVGAKRLIVWRAPVGALHRSCQHCIFDISSHYVPKCLLLCHHVVTLTLTRDLTESLTSVNGHTRNNGRRAQIHY